MAGRTPKPWFWSKRKAWFVTINGERHRLAPNKAEALKRFHELMAGSEPPRTVVGGGKATLGEVINRYLAKVTRRLKPETLEVTRNYLTPFTRALGSRPVPSLTPDDIDAAVEAHGRWNPTTKNRARGRLVTALNWAVTNRVIPSNPLANLWRPPARSRGVEAVIPTDSHDRLMTAALPYLRDVLFTLHRTGARPCEVLSATAADFDPAAGVWILHDHKTVGKTGAPRVVFLPPEVVELCTRLAERHPTGPLFRRQKGTPFPSSHYLAKMVRKLRRKLGLPETVIAYGFRHTFATDALAGGVPEAHVAELLGHKGTAMLHKHYSHLGTKAAVLRAALGRVRG